MGAFNKVIKPIIIINTDTKIITASGDNCNFKN